MNTLGTIVPLFSSAFLIFSLFLILRAYKVSSQNPDLHALYLRKAGVLLKGNFFLVLLSFSILIYQLVMSDLSNYYSVMHSSSQLSLFYRLTSVWAGSAGSLLFWNLLLSFFVLIHLNFSEAENDPIQLSIFSLTGLFFTLLSIFFPDAQPFREFDPPAVTGRGLNPLLLHWAMILHPPILYIGYVSFLIPFAISMKSLLSKNGDLLTDIRQLRRWALFSWFFLGTGILLGSKWAYEELGWGGYWAWDPVENASLMPWLLCSAFIHSLIIQERRGMLKFWNMVLVILTYHFVLLGTWITRSGVLEGPHSFAKSTIGTPFIVFIITHFLFFIFFLIHRFERLRPDRRIEAVTSKEGSFLFNNFILVLACGVILLGVFSPLLYGREFRAPWYNSWGVPTGIFLLFLMGVAPLLAWRKSADTVFFSSLLIPFLAGSVGGAIYSIFITGYFTKTHANKDDFLSEVYSGLTIFLAIFTITGVIQEFYKGIRARKEAFPEENFFSSAGRMVLRNKRRYGGYLVHISIVLLFTGYAGNAYKQNTSLSFIYSRVAPPSPGIIAYKTQDRAYLGEYEVEGSSLLLKTINQPSNLNKNTTIPTITEESIFFIKKRGDLPIPLLTERRFYPQISHLSGTVETQIPTSEPAIHSYLHEDFYIQLGAIESADSAGSENPDLPAYYLEYLYTGKEGESTPKGVISNFPERIIVNLEVWINPLVKLIWLGSIGYFLAGLLLILPAGEKEGKV